MPDYEIIETTAEEIRSTYQVWRDARWQMVDASLDGEYESEEAVIVRRPVPDPAVHDDTDARSIRDALVFSEVTLARGMGLISTDGVPQALRVITDTGRGIEVRAERGRLVIEADPAGPPPPADVHPPEDLKVIPAEDEHPAPSEEVPESIEDVKAEGRAAMAALGVDSPLLTRFFAPARAEHPAPDDRRWWIVLLDGEVTAYGHDPRFYGDGVTRGEVIEVVPGSTAGGRRLSERPQAEHPAPDGDALASDAEGLADPMICPECVASENVRCSNCGAVACDHRGDRSIEDEDWLCLHCALSEARRLAAARPERETEGERVAVTLRYHEDHECDACGKSPVVFPFDNGYGWCAECALDDLSKRIEAEHAPAPESREAEVDPRIGPNGVCGSSSVDPFGDIVECTIRPWNHVGKHRDDRYEWNDATDIKPLAPAPVSPREEDE